MPDSIDNILNNLDVSANNFKNAKDRLAKRAEQLGYEEHKARAEFSVWEDIKKSDKKPPRDLLASGEALTDNYKDQSYVVLDKSQLQELDNTLWTASAASATVSGTTVSGMSYAYPEHDYPQSYNYYLYLIKQKNEQELMGETLDRISPDISKIYKNAWKSLYNSSDDITRSPMFLMREVITHLLHHFAPDNNFSDNLANDGNIRRVDRIEYIAQKFVDSWDREALTLQLKELDKSYNRLSYAHKQGKLDEEKSKGFLYQADGLIKLLLKTTKY